MFIIGKILAALVFPPGIFIALAAACAILAIKNKRKAAAIVAILDALLLYALSTGAVSSLLIAPLENGYPPIIASDDARAIVVLGGGYNDSSPERGGAGSLTPISSMRASYGYELSRKFGLPLVFTGGRPYVANGRGSEAEAAGDAWQALGEVKGRISLETESLDTKGNAAGVEKLAGAGPFVLVTSAFHMPRAVMAFKKAGIRVLAAPTDYRAKRSSLTFTDFLPDTWRLECSRSALHEYVGILYYLLT